MKSTQHDHVKLDENWETFSYAWSSIICTSYMVAYDKEDDRGFLFGCFSEEGRCNRQLSRVPLKDIL